MKPDTQQHTRMTCIVCPVGCQLSVAASSKDGNHQVTGNQCPRGEQYAIEEITHPTRMLTTTVKLNHGNVTRLPVKTARPVPKSLLHECMHQLNQLEVEAPVKQGQVLMTNLLNTGIDVIATRSA